MVDYTWTITKIDALPPDYKPTTMDWNVVGREGTKLQMMVGSFNIEHLTEGLTFSDITEEMAMGWLMNDLLSPEAIADYEVVIADLLAKQVARDMRMSQKPNVPWDTTFKAAK